MFLQIDISRNSEKFYISKKMDLTQTQLNITFVITHDGESENTNSCSNNKAKWPRTNVIKVKNNCHYIIEKEVSFILLSLRSAHFSLSFLPFMRGRKTKVRLHAKSAGSLPFDLVGEPSRSTTGPSGSPTRPATVSVHS